MIPCSRGARSLLLCAHCEVSTQVENGDEATKRFAADNNPLGAETIANNILECCRRLSINNVFAGVESTSVYGWHLQFYLADYLGLKHYDPIIISFNAKIIET